MARRPIEHILERAYPVHELGKPTRLARPDEAAQDEASIAQRFVKASVARARQRCLTRLQDDANNAPSLKLSADARAEWTCLKMGWQ